MIALPPNFKSLTTAKQSQSNKKGKYGNNDNIIVLENAKKYELEKTLFLEANFEQRQKQKRQV